MEKDKDKKEYLVHEGANCAYHHCRKSCMSMNKDSCKDGKCLFTRKIGVKCLQTRCEYFKQGSKR